MHHWAGTNRNDSGLRWVIMQFLLIKCFWGRFPAPSSPQNIMETRPRKQSSDSLTPWVTLRHEKQSSFDPESGLLSAFIHRVYGMPVRQALSPAGDDIQKSLLLWSCPYSLSEGNKCY